MLQAKNFLSPQKLVSGVGANPESANKLSLGQIPNRSMKVGLVDTIVSIIAIAILLIPPLL